MIFFIKKMLRVLYVIFGVWHSLCYRFSAARAYVIVTAANLVREGGAVIVETLSSISKAIDIVIHKGRVCEHAGSCRKEQKYLNILAVDTVVLVKLKTARHGFPKQAQTFLL